MSELVVIPTSICFVCGTAGAVTVPAEAYTYWKTSGEFIQVALPMLSADEREQLLTGIHGQCFDSVMDDDFEDIG